jgi:hypothetical protein
MFLLLYNEYSWYGGDCGASIRIREFETLEDLKKYTKECNMHSCDYKIIIGKVLE